MRKTAALLVLFACLGALCLAAAAWAGDQPTKWAMGDKVLVDWRGQWIPATIIDVGLRVAVGTYKVHYDGWDAGWDEWVWWTRIKPRS